jgi:hypothetical protein
MFYSEVNILPGSRTTATSTQISSFIVVTLSLNYLSFAHYLNSEPLRSPLIFIFNFITSSTHHTISSTHYISYQLMISNFYENLMLATIIDSFGSSLM